MILKNRVILYSWTKKIVNYLDPRENTTEICCKIIEEGEPDLYWTIPQCCETPRDIEMYCLGLEQMNRKIKIERKDIKI